MLTRVGCWSHQSSKTLNLCQECAIPRGTGLANESILWERGFNIHSWPSIPLSYSCAFVVFEVMLQDALPRSSGQCHTTGSAKPIYEIPFLTGFNYSHMEQLKTFLLMNNIHTIFIYIDQGLKFCNSSLEMVIR